MKKQTIWLVSMLTLMVVLSGYYLVTGPVEPVQQVEQEDSDQTSEAKVDVKTVSNEEKEQARLDKRTDFFINYHLQRDTLRSKMTEEYMRVLSDPEASKNELQEAEAKINELMKMDKQESTAEELIRKEGFQDAVVINRDAKVDVIVQSDQLEKSEVVSIIGLVGKHFQIAPTQVSVQYQS